MTEKNNHIDFEILSARYLTGSATPDEVTMLEEWVKTDEEKRRLFFEIKKSWMVVSTKGQVYDKTLAWKSIARETGTQEGKENIRPLYSGIFYKKAWKVAATVLLLIAGLYSVIYFTQLQEKTLVAGNETLELELNDGTTININKHSSLTYPVKFRSGERRVILEGEAYFDVAQDLQKPFIVEAQDVEIMVLGTSFFISAFKDAPEVEVMVNSGKVALIAPDSRQLALVAGSKGVYNKEENQLIEDKIVDPNYLSWKTGLIIFDNTPLAEVFKVLERAYGIQFRIMDEELQSCRLTATFDNKPLEDILTIIRETFEIRFTRSNGIINVYGESCE
jgi:ferric-dicitrate binding protein FerR (iron transport regulator)